MILDGVTLSTQIGAKVRWGRVPPCSGGRIQGSALPKGALLLQAPGPPGIHVSAEVAVPALSSQRGSAAVAMGSGSARTGPRPPGPGPLLLDDTGGVSNAEGCGWRVARSGVPTRTLAGETPGSFSPTPRQPELAFLPRETRNKEVPLLRVARGTPLPLGKAILFLKQLTWLLREP